MHHRQHAWGRAAATLYKYRAIDAKPSSCRAGTIHRSFNLFLISQGRYRYGLLLLLHGLLGDAAGVRAAGVDGRGAGHGVPPGAAAGVRAGPHRHLQARAQ